MTPVAQMGHSPRIVQGKEIVNPLGDPAMDPKAEKELRRQLVEKGLEALQTEVTESTLFERSKRTEKD